MKKQGFETKLFASKCHALFIGSHCKKRALFRKPALIIFIICVLLKFLPAIRFSGLQNISYFRYLLSFSRKQSHKHLYEYSNILLSFGYILGNIIGSPMPNPNFLDVCIMSQRCERDILLNLTKPVKANL